MVILWKLVIAVFDVSPFVLPQPEDVIGGMRDLVSSDGFWSDVRVTLIETLVGFGIALVLGIVLGTLLGRVQLARAGAASRDRRLSGRARRSR